MINNVVLVSGVQQGDSVIYLHVSILFVVIYRKFSSQWLKQKNLLAPTTLHSRLYRGKTQWSWDVIRMGSFDPGSASSRLAASPLVWSDDC